MVLRKNDLDVTLQKFHFDIKTVLTLALELNLN